MVYSASDQEIKIQEKVGLFNIVLNDRTKLLYVRDLIYWKRMKWLDDNYVRVKEELKKYNSAVEKAFRLVFFEYMKIDPNSVEAVFLPDTEHAKAVFIKSRNFCPYLEAMRRLGIEEEARFYCKLVTEDPVESLANEFLFKEGHRFGVWFGRNYDAVDDGIVKEPTGIRPYLDECQEFFVDRSIRPREFANFLKTFECGLEYDYTNYRDFWWLPPSRK